MGVMQQLSQDELKRVFTSTAEAKGLPGWVYHDPAFFEAERERFFKRIWTGICFESEVPEPGDVLPVSYAGWEFIVVRGEDRRVRVFHNLCRHRAMRVVDAPRKNCRTLSCPWHMWTYDLTGKLISTPNFGGTGRHKSPHIGTDGGRLLEVRADSWLGIVLVNIDGKAPPLAEFMKPLRDRLLPYDVSLTRESDLTHEIYYEGNWKLCIEGGVENYHIPFVHKQMGPEGGFEAVCGGDTFVGVAGRRTIAASRARIRVAEGDDAPKSLPLFPHLPEMGECETTIILVMLPGTIYSPFIDHIVTTIYTPVSPTLTRVQRRFRFVGEEGARDPAYEAARRRIRDGWALISEQDGPLIKEVHRLAPLRDEIGLETKFSPAWEGAVHHLQKIVAHKVAGVPLQ